MLHFVCSCVFEIMVYHERGVVGTIIRNTVLAQDLPHRVLCYFVTGETDSPKISVDTKLVENTALYPKGEFLGN